MNAAASFARFYKLDEIDNLDEELIFAEYWTHKNPIEQDRRKKIVCAEVLVPDYVPAKLIKGFYVHNESSLKIAKKTLSKFGLSDSVRTERDLFF